MPRLEGPALLEGLKAAQGDRDRARLVMAVLPETLSADAEKGIRLVRDSLPIFERVGAMDGALARLVREGQVPDPSLARFKRVLEKFHAGHHLTSTFEAISSREAPEAWKVALSQLKLGG